MACKDILEGKLEGVDVLVVPMHPEYYPSTYDILAGGFKALTGRPVTFKLPPKDTFRPLLKAWWNREGQM